MADAGDSVFDLIENGQVDESLNDIIEAAQRRRKYLSTQLVREVEEGDKLRIVPGTLNKRYLDGATFVVAETPVGRTTKVVVTMAEESIPAHDPYNKYRGKRVVVPAAALERVT